MAVEIGSVYEGAVTGLQKFGAFVKLQDGTVGLVHISEVADEFVSDISEKLTVGDSVKVKVIEISENGKVSFSIKKAIADEKPKPKKPRPRDGAGKGWKGASSQNQNTAMSFEDMMARFKAQSDDKMSDLKRNTDKRGGSRRK